MKTAGRVRPMRVNLAWRADALRADGAAQVRASETLAVVDVGQSLLQNVSS